MALSINSRGTKVEKIQQFLDSQGYDLGTAGIDGIYGQDTREAVRDFQYQHALRTDGIAGDSTITIMRREGLELEEE